MVHRALDVVFQHLIKLAAGLIMVPLLMGGIGYALDRAPTVGVRLWAQHPVYRPSFAPDHFTSYQWPSFIEASLLTELLATDTFVDRLLSTTDPQSLHWSQERRDSVVADLRQNIAATPEGEHLFLITYRTTQIDRGRAILDNLLVAFSAEMEAIDTETVAVAESALKNQYNSAKQALETAIKQAETYRVQHANANADPNYKTLVASAEKFQAEYLTLQAQIAQVQQSKSAVGILKASFFTLIDPPTLLPQPIITKRSPALRLAVGGLAGVLAVEALIVYVIARRDPGIRSIEDVRRRLGIRPLGTAPPVRPR